MGSQDIFLEFRFLRSKLGHLQNLKPEEKKEIYAHLDSIEKSYMAMEDERNEWRTATALLAKKIAFWQKGFWQRLLSL